MNTSRRSFFKYLVGAFVASAIELNMTVETRVGQLETRVGQLEKLTSCLNEMVQEMWLKRCYDEWERLGSVQTRKLT